MVRAVLIGERSERPDRNAACGEFARWFKAERRVIFWHGRVLRSYAVIWLDSGLRKDVESSFFPQSAAID